MTEGAETQANETAVVSTAPVDPWAREMYMDPDIEQHPAVRPPARAVAGCHRRIGPLSRRNDHPRPALKLLRDVCALLRDDERSSFSMLTDVTAVDMLRLRENPRFDVVVLLYSLKNRVRLRLKAGVERRRAGAVAGSDLEWRQLAGARGLRHVRHHFRRSSQPAPHVCCRTTGTRAFRCARTTRCAAGRSSRSTTPSEPSAASARAGPGGESKHHEHCRFQPSRHRRIDTRFRSGGAQDRHADDHRRVDARRRLAPADPQHGAAAPEHARRAAGDPETRRRDHHRLRPGHRLSAPRRREAGRGIIATPRSSPGPTAPTTSPRR